MKEQEFAELVKMHKSTIYTVCYMFSQDKNEIDDLFQEAMIRLWQGYQSFRGESDLKTWVYRVTLNTCISQDKKNKRGATRSLIEGIDLFDEKESNNAQSEILHQRILKLQPFDRAIVLLWLEDMSYEDIGAIVGITAKNVSVRLVRIREQLKNM